MKSINPYSGKLIREYSIHSHDEVESILQKVQKEWESWKNTTFEQRSSLMFKAASILRNRKKELATLITEEMGKLIRESEAEIEKCAWVCEYYAENAERMLGNEFIETDATKSYITFLPIGIVLAVMPWNFPFWQVFRFAAPALMAGNAGVLKHASNVPGCALAIEKVFHDAGFPEYIFKTLMIPAANVENVIQNPFIKAITLTGSEEAGSRVASVSGKNIKKTVLELGGSDPFIILEDADIEKAVKTALNARMINQGQSCIAAKRFIVMKSVLETVENKLVDALKSLKPGNPLNPETDIAPLARPDLVDDIEKQVNSSIQYGAKLLSGGNRISSPGNFYEPTILTDVRQGMPVCCEETFGPVFAIIPVETEEEAINIANDSLFGLGGSVWTKDTIKGEKIALRVNSGAVFVNGMTKSDPRLPFGGVGKSGYGRELGQYGIKEFVNIKTIWIG